MFLVHILTDDENHIVSLSSLSLRTRNARHGARKVWILWSGNVPGRQGTDRVQGMSTGHLLQQKRRKSESRLRQVGFLLILSLFLMVSDQMHDYVSLFLVLLLLPSFFSSPSLLLFFSSSSCFLRPQLRRRQDHRREQHGQCQRDELLVSLRVSIDGWHHAPGVLPERDQMRRLPTRRILRDEGRCEN